MTRVSVRVLRICMVFVFALGIPGITLAAMPAAGTPAQVQTITTPNSIELSGLAPDVAHANSYITVPYDKALNPTAAITIEAWVKPTSTGGCQTIVGNNWTISYWLGICEGKIRFYPHGDDSAVDGTRTILAGEWSHLAVTYNGKFRRYYINGMLDPTLSEIPGELTPGESKQPLEIGADTLGGGYYFGGRIQDLRIWTVARTAQQIAGGMNQFAGGPLPGLAAEWPFAGNTDDVAGGHNGVGVDEARYSLDTAIPRTIHIPQVASAPTLDGECDTGEYASATRVMVGEATARLLHTANDLWICFTGLAEPAAGVTDNWAAVYLDPDYARGGWTPMGGYYSFELHAFGEPRRARHSSGGAFTTIAYNPADWDGVYNGGDGAWVGNAEFRISRQFIGGWPRIVGLSLAQHGVPADGDGLLWPARVNINRFNTWGTGLLPAISARSYTLSGQVIYRSQSGEVLSGVPGLRIRLVGYDIDPSRTEIPLDEMESGLDGSFSFTVSDAFTQHRIILDPANMAAGLAPTGSSTPWGSGYTTSIYFENLASGVYPNNNFYLGDPVPQPLDAQGGPYFLIITNDDNVRALASFVDYKTRLGFQVEVATLATITATTPGGMLSEQIRNFEIARKATYGARFRYLLLVGSNNTIPIRQFAPFATSLANIYQQLVPTDWYYADLTSDFDSNHNNWLADGIWSRPQDRAAGYTPDSGITFTPAVALGRLPFDTPDLLTRYLNSAMSFEQSTPAYKTRALLAGAMLILQGRCWYPPHNPNGQWYQYDGDKCNDYVWGISSDGSVLMEQIKNNTLIPSGFTNTTTFYENEHPATGHSPATNISPQPLTRANFFNALEGADYGMINLVGHGDAGGIARTTWATDPNGNNIMESPGGPPGYIDERGGGEFIRVEFLSSPRPAARKPGIFITQSCSTIYWYEADTLGARLLSTGYAVAYVGGLEKEWGGSDRFDAMVTDLVLAHGQRLGDAFWNTNRTQIHEPLPNTTFLVEDLFGDPTLSYWGNPGQQSVLAPWPMQRADPTGRSQTSLPGPSEPHLQWSVAGAAPAAAGLPPSPVMSSAGEVIVANGNGVDVLVNGALYQRLPLDAQAYGAPAVAADGTIYALDVSGGLYAFRYTNDLRGCLRGGCGGSLVSPTRTQRWKSYLGGTPITSPVIASDGAILAARAYNTSSVIEMFRPDGREWMAAQLIGQITGGLTVTADQKVYVTASGGRLISVDFYCSLTNNNACWTTQTDAGTYTTVPLAAGGSIYAGMADGTLVKKSAATLATQASFHADSAITSGPLLGPDGQVVFGTQNGTLYSLDAALNLRWSRATGAAVAGLPAFSSTALYVANSDNLRAYNPTNGALLWSIPMGSGTGSGGVAVGYGREVLVQMSNGKINNVGEGWMHQPWYFSVTPVINGSGQSAVGVIRLQWSYLPPPPTAQDVAAGLASVSQAAFPVQQFSPSSLSPVEYLLQRSDNGGDWVDLGFVAAGSLPADVVTYTDTDTQPGHTYAYRIQTLDPTGQGLDADFATGAAQLALPSIPGAPSLVQVQADGAHSLVLKWKTDGSAASGFRIERAPALGGPFSPVTTASSASDDTFTDTGLAANTPYYYRVVALNDTGESLPSNVLSGKTRALSLAAPVNVHAALAASGNVVITWDAGPGGATAYVESSGFAVASFSPAGTAPANSGTFTFEPSTLSSYAFRVKFVNGDSESEYTQADLRVSTGGFTPFPMFKVFLPAMSR